MNTILGCFSTVLFKTERNVYEVVVSLANSPSCISTGQHSVVGIATRYGLDGPGIESQSGGGAGFSVSVQTGPAAHPALCTKVAGSLSWGVKRPGRGVDHPPPSSAEVKKEWSYTSTVPLGLCVQF